MGSLPEQDSLTPRFLEPSTCTCEAEYAGHPSLTSSLIHIYSSSFIACGLANNLPKLGSSCLIPSMNGGSLERETH